MMPPGFIATMELNPPLSDSDQEAAILADIKAESDDSTP